MIATVYCGLSRDTEVPVEVDDLGCGAARIPCLECGGSGVRAFMEPEIPAAA